MGSRADARAGGGPIVAAGTDAFVLAALPTHGGRVPRLVAGGSWTIGLEVAGGFGGARLELDGRIAVGHEGSLEVGLRPGAATLVGLGAAEKFLTGLRERGVVADSPRILAEDARHPA